MDQLVAQHIQPVEQDLQQRQRAVAAQGIAVAAFACVAPISVPESATAQSHFRIDTLRGHIDSRVKCHLKVKVKFKLTQLIMRDFFNELT